MLGVSEIDASGSRWRVQWLLDPRTVVGSSPVFENPLIAARHRVANIRLTAAVARPTLAMLRGESLPFRIFASVETLAPNQPFGQPPARLRALGAGRPIFSPIHVAVTIRASRS